MKVKLTEKGDSWSTWERRVRAEVADRERRRVKRIQAPAIAKLDEMRRVFHDTPHGDMLDEVRNRIVDATKASKKRLQRLPCGLQEA